MMFQTYKVVILSLVIFYLVNVIHSYQCDSQCQNQTQNNVHMELDEQIETINQHPELFQYNTLPLVVCLFFINQQI